MTLWTHAPGSAPLAWSTRIGNAAVSCIAYVVGFFYPADLATFYPTAPGGPSAWKVAAAIAILAIASGAAVIWRRKCPYLFVGWFWFLGMLFPVLGLVAVSSHAMADRYMYLPGVGLCIALAWGAGRLVAGLPQRRWVLGTCAGLAIAVLVACADRQTSYWRDDETLWRHALACTGGNSKAETALANALVRQGRREEAIALYQRAQSRRIDSWPFSNLGALLSWEEKWDEAIEQFSQGLVVEPDAFLVHVNLAIALGHQDRFDEALQHFRRRWKSTRAAWRRIAAWRNCCCARQD